MERTQIQSVSEKSTKTTAVINKLNSLNIILISRCPLQV